MPQNANTGTAWKILAGALVTISIGLAANRLSQDALIAGLQAQADAAIAGEGGRGVTADFTTANGWLTRHPTLHGGKRLSDDTRGRVARAVASLPGVGGVHWDSRGQVKQGAPTTPLEEHGPFHCQRDVEALLEVRVVRFDQGSARITRDSRMLLDEVAAALKPCKGSIVAIKGHSDSLGDAAVNMRLSRERAEAVRDALVRRGLPRASLRAEGYGSSEPVEGLDPADPANRRIEFSVIEIAPMAPTPIDTPDAG